MKKLAPSLDMFCAWLGVMIVTSTMIFAQSPPPSAPAQKSPAELETLLGPIALYPDSLVATILPASVYPLEIVQAARFVADTNNLAKLEEQTWDENVKAVARVPEVIKQMNDDLNWTTELGQVFVAQQKDVMDTIQNLRNMAQKAGTLQTTPQQTIIVTNTIVEKTIEEKVVVVTNTVVQIQPTNPEIVYVPTYNPAVVYAPPPGPPPILTFAAGVAVGAIIANNCDWNGGGIYVGHHGVAVWGGGGGGGDVDIDINRNVNINQNNNINVNNRTVQNNVGAQGAKWQPDQARMRNSGAPASSQAAAARGYPAANAPAARPQNATASNLAAPGAGAAGTRAPATATPRPADSKVAASAPRATPSAAPATQRAAQPQRAAAPQAQAKPSAFSGAGGPAADRASSERGHASRQGSHGKAEGGRSRR